MAQVQVRNERMDERMDERGVEDLRRQICVGVESLLVGRAVNDEHTLTIEAARPVLDGFACPPHHCRDYDAIHDGVGREDCARGGPLRVIRVGEDANRRDDRPIGEPRALARIGVHQVGAANRHVTPAALLHVVAVGEAGVSPGYEEARICDNGVPDRQHRASVSDDVRPREDPVIVIGLGVDKFESESFEDITHLVDRGDLGIGEVALHELVDPRHREILVVIFGVLKRNVID